MRLRCWWCCIEATAVLLQHGRVQHLQVELGDLVLAPIDRALFPHSLTRQRWDWFLKTLRKAKKRQQGRLLRTSVEIDRCGTSTVSKWVNLRSLLEQKDQWPRLSGKGWGLGSSCRRQLDVKLNKELNWRYQRSIPRTVQIWERSEKEGGGTREVLAALLRRLCDSIEGITIQSLAMSEERYR